MQAELFDLKPQGVTWRRQPCGDTHKADYQMLRDGEPTGTWVRWCGHPTAHRPYFVDFADGFRTFRTVAEAKAAAARGGN